MDAPGEPDVVETVLWWASQTGKTEVVISIAGYHMDADPAPQLLVQPTVDLAKAFSEERLAPEIRENRVLKRKVMDPRSRDSGNKILSKRYPGGSLVIVGANSPSGLAGRPRRVILLDEVDRYPVSAGTEGDPCALADKRAESFPNAVKVKTSTATIKGLSKIEKLYEGSDQQKWHVCCPSCKAEYLFAWAQVKWPQGKPEEAWMECPHCAAKFDDEGRRARVRAGKWKATAPFHGRRGFWLNGMNTLFPAHKGYRNRIHQFAAEFLKAKDDGPQTIKVWVNTFLAETYEEDADALDAAQIRERGEDYDSTSLPEDVLILTAAADVQRMRIECEVKGWGVDEECWGVCKLVLDGDTEKDDVWNQLDDVFRREFAREDGVTLRIERAFVDMGYRSKQVLKFCGPRIGRVYPCRGINRVGTNPPPLLPAKPCRNNKARIPHWNVGVTVAKTAIFDRLKMEPGGARTVHFPKEDGYDDNHFRQFAAEKRMLRYSAGVPYYIFEKLNNAVRNEALDLFVYNLAAMFSLMPIYWHRVRAARKRQAEKLDAKREAKPTAEKAVQSADAQEVKSDVPSDGEAKPEAKPANYTEQAVAAQLRRMRRRIRGRGGFVGRW
jgi:phage terminase large subunit GpA-like protein